MRRLLREVRAPLLEDPGLGEGGVDPEAEHQRARDEDDVDADLPGRPHLTRVPKERKQGGGGVSGHRGTGAQRE